MSDPARPVKRKSRRSKPQTLLVRIAVFVLVALLLGAVFALGMMFGAGWTTTQTLPTTAAVPSEGIPVKPGPWGELFYTPLTISAPDEILPFRALEAKETHWFFKNFSRDDFAAFLHSANVPAEQMDALLDPSALHVQPNGIDVTPSFESLSSLPPDSRQEIYRCLARFPENNAQLFYFQTATLKERFDGSTVSQETIELFIKLSCKNGNYIVFSGLPSLLSHLQKDGEKVSFLKALSRQQTMLLRLRVRSDSDIDALSKYWGTGCRATDVRTMLQSISRMTDWAWFDILKVLPPLPLSQLYSYPVVPDNPPGNPPVEHDSQWTSFNFFRNVPDDNFANPDYIARQLGTNYDPVTGNPLYGDMVLISKLDGSIVHSAVYLADDIVFTKNGSTAIDPWMLSNMSDLLDQYSFRIPPDQKLTVRYFRIKSP